MAQVKRCGINDSDDCPETLDKGLWQFDGYDPQSCGVGSIFTPTSPWPRGTMEEENIHFKVAGVLMRQNLKVGHIITHDSSLLTCPQLFIESTEQMLIEDGLDREVVAHWKAKAREGELYGLLPPTFSHGVFRNGVGHVQDMVPLESRLGVRTKRS
jgi:hypothetical protein